jgi:hypothetical protein
LNSKAEVQAISVNIKVVVFFLYVPGIHYSCLVLFMYIPFAGLSSHLFT